MNFYESPLVKELLAERKRLAEELVKKIDSEEGVLMIKAPETMITGDFFSCIDSRQEEDKMDLYAKERVKDIEVDFGYNRYFVEAECEFVSKAGQAFDIKDIDIEKIWMEYDDDLLGVVHYEKLPMPVRKEIKYVLKEFFANYTADEIAWQNDLPF